MKITNKYGLPENLVKIIENDKYRPTNDRISVTELGNSIAEIVYRRRWWDELEEDVADNISSLMGTAFHNLMGVDEDTEIKLTYTFENGLTLSGRMDHFKDGIIQDHKLTSVNKYLKGDFNDFLRQGLCYSWLLSKNGIMAFKMRFNLFLRDWSLMRAINDSNYPRTQIVFWEYEIRTSDLIEIERYINERIDLIAKYINAPDNEIPRMTDDELWYSGTKYAAMRNGGSRAIRLCDTYEEALKIPCDYIETRKGIYIKPLFSNLVKKILALYEK